MNKPKNTYWDFDEKGGMVFHTQNEILKERHHEQNRATMASIGAVFFIVVCSLIDIFVIYQLFTPLMNNSLLYRIFASSALFMGFDVAPVYLGRALKRKEFGFKINKGFVAIAIVAFFVAVFINFDLRMHSNKSAVDTANAENIMDTSTEEEETTAEDPMSGAMARALSFFPLITSFTSFFISHETSDPLKKEIQRKEKELNKLKNDLNYSKAALKEFDKNPTEEDLLERDKKLLEEAIKSTYITGKLYTDHARNYLLQLIETTASGITYISDHPQEEYDALMAGNNNLLLTNNQQATECSV